MPRPSRSLLLVVATTLLVSSTLLAQSDRPAKGRWQCDTNVGGPTIYATPFFEWTGLADELQNAFQQHLLARYGYKAAEWRVPADQRWPSSMPTCSGSTSSFAPRGSRW